jgi:hypothetical protein
MLPLAVPTGPANTAPIDVLVIAAIGACLLWAARSGFRCRYPYALAMGLMLLGGALAALVGPVPNRSMVALCQDVLLLAWCWTVANLCHSAANLRVALATWAYSGIAWACTAFVGLATGSTLLTGQIERQGTRVQITLADPSYAANYFFLSLMIIWATQRPRRRSARVTAYALLIGGIASTGSNSGLVALTVGTIVAATLGTHRRYGAAPAVALLTVIVLGGAFVASQVSLTEIQAKAHDSKYGFLRQGIGRSPDSSGQRETLLHESLRLYKSGSPLGEGPVSTKPRLESEMGPLIKEAHSDYFASLTERGPLGFIGMLLLVAGLGRRALGATLRPLRPDFAAVVKRPHALVAALAGTLVAMTVYELLHVRHVWALFALVAALFIWGRE